jgi:hypothetical protein
MRPQQEDFVSEAFNLAQNIGDSLARRRHEQASGRCLPSTGPHFVVNQASDSRATIALHPSPLSPDS